MQSSWDMIMTISSLSFETTFILSTFFVLIYVLAYNASFLQEVMEKVCRSKNQRGLRTKNYSFICKFLFLLLISSILISYYTIFYECHLPQLK